MVVLLNLVILRILRKLARCLSLLNSVDNKSFELRKKLSFYLTTAISENKRFLPVSATFQDKQHRGRVKFLYSTSFLVGGIFIH